MHRLGPQADGTKLLTVYYCTTQFHRELGQNSSFGTMDKIIFRIFTPKFDKLPRGQLPYRIISLWSCFRQQSDFKF